jgi:DNA-binding MarR family transcriptional regulator
MPSLDLTPFGFTPTESQAYCALLERGPLGGYALAKALAIARANAYQALHGLETKGAVKATTEEPRRYRPVAPDALFAQIVERESRQLDVLEAALRAGSMAGAPDMIRFTGQRSLDEQALRMAARTTDLVDCLGPASLLERLAPVWHKRAADGSQTRLWVTGDGGEKLPIPIAGRIGPDSVAAIFGGLPVVLASPAAAIVAVEQAVGGDLQGFWSNDRVLVGLAHAALRALTS